ncbi:MAG: hypothetical protein QE487_14555 [Fluviicola sp.]|nr:hypothetical protein [Fluviicola sp.]
MKQLLRFSLFLLVVLSGSSCSEDLAEDGTKRGVINYVGKSKHNGKNYAVFVYSRMETIESADQSTGYFYYWLTYTLDAKTGKQVYSTEYEIGDYSGAFIGVSDQYAFFSAKDEVYAIDLYANNKIVKPVALKALIRSKNQQIKQSIARIEVDAYRNLRVITSSGDLYLLNRTTLKGKLIEDSLKTDPAYQLSFIENFYGNTQLIGNSSLGFVLSDTTTLLLESFNPSNSYQAFLHKASHPSRQNYVEMMRNMQYEKLDSAVFLQGNILGLSDNGLTLTYLNALGSSGKEYIGLYQLDKHAFRWSKPVQSLYDPVENSNTYTLSWNPDGTSFFIGAASNNYTPFSLVDAKTGKVKWKF